MQGYSFEEAETKYQEVLVELKSAFCDSNPDNLESIIYHKLFNIFILEYFMLCKKMPLIKLQTSEEEIVIVDVEIARRSNVLNTMLEYLGMDDLEDAVPIPNVNSAILKTLIEWLDYHKDDKPKEKNAENGFISNDVCSWDINFFKVNRHHLKEIITAATYLDIGCFLDVACIMFANMIKARADDFESYVPKSEGK